MDAVYHIVVVTDNIATMQGLRDDRAREIELHGAHRRSRTAPRRLTTRRISRCSVYQTCTRRTPSGKSEFCLEHALKYCIDAYPDHSTELWENLRRLARRVHAQGRFRLRERCTKNFCRRYRTCRARVQNFMTEFVAEIYTELARALQKLKELEDAKRAVAEGCRRSAGPFRRILLGNG